MTKNS